MPRAFPLTDRPAPAEKKGWPGSPRGGSLSRATGARRSAIRSGRMPSVPELLQAYRATRYQIVEPTAALPVLAEARIGSRSEVDRLLEGHDAGSGVFITAWNPRSQVVPRAGNEAAHRRLEHALRRLGIRFLAISAWGPRSHLGAEWGLFALDLPRALALDLAVTFGQNAIVLIAHGQPAEPGHNRAHADGLSGLCRGARPGGADQAVAGDDVGELRLVPPLRARRLLRAGRGSAVRPCCRGRPRPSRPAAQGRTRHTARGSRTTRCGRHGMPVWRRPQQQARVAGAQRADHCAPRPILDRPDRYAAGIDPELGRRGVDVSEQPLPDRSVQARATTRAPSAGGCAHRSSPAPGAARRRRPRPWPGAGRSPPR